MSTDPTNTRMTCTPDAIVTVKMSDASYSSHKPAHRCGLLVGTAQPVLVGSWRMRDTYGGRDQRASLRLHVELGRIHNTLRFQQSSGPDPICIIFLVPPAHPMQESYCENKTKSPGCGTRKSRNTGRRLMEPALRAEGPVQSAQDGEGQSGNASVERPASC